uniref:Uncharacterized protein n=1 Tax=Arundo donax TaxID=35708 RepID=A0A0A9GXE0_ARUDO
MGVKIENWSTRNSQKVQVNLKRIFVLRIFKLKQEQN